MRRHMLTACALAVVALVGLSGCTALRGSGQVVTEDRPVSDVGTVQLSGIGRLEVTQGSPAKLTVETDDNLMQYVSTEVKGDRLIISVKSFGLPIALIEPSTTIIYRLQVSEPRALQLSGSGEIVANGLDVSTLDVDISGSGKAELSDLKADAFNYGLSGSGKADVSGEVDREGVNVSGSGRLTAGELKASSVSVSISGSGDATVWAVDTLDVKVSGSGSVKYYGSPSVNQQVSGSGRLESLGAK
jgi:Putative auto-transporter adhesin, head GIN domain